MEKNEESVENIDTNKKEDNKEKKVFNPIILYIIAFIITVIIGNAVGSFSTIKEIEKTYGAEVAKNITQEEAMSNPKYKSIYTENNLRSITTVQCIVFSIMVIILVIINHKKFKSDFKRWNKKEIIYVLVASVALYLFNWGLSTLFEYLNVSTSNQDTIISMMNTAMIPAVIYSTILAPIAEEMICRYSIGTIIKNKYAFMVISSLLFAVAHGIGIITILYFLIGIGLAIIYLKTNKNITATIFAHMFNNTIATILMLL